MSLQKNKEKKLNKNTHNVSHRRHHRHRYRRRRRRKDHCEFGNRHFFVTILALSAIHCRHRRRLRRVTKFAEAHISIVCLGQK